MNVKQMSEPSSTVLIQSLRSELCPACGCKKKPGMSLCGWDYWKLPRPMAQALYKRVGEGYAEALEDAMRHLYPDGQRHWPKEERDA